MNPLRKFLVIYLINVRFLWMWFWIILIELSRRKAYRRYIRKKHDALESLGQLENQA